MSDHKNPRIFYLAPCVNTPLGGVKQIYRHVDILNKNSFPAFVLHPDRNFRCAWFENQTEVCYVPDTTLTTDDYLVIPEIDGPELAKRGPGLKKIVFNQNPYYTFLNYDLEPSDMKTPYTDPEVIGTIVTSDFAEEYFSHVFPDHELFKVRLGIDSEVFYPPAQDEKKKQAIFMLRKAKEDVQQVLNILKFRGTLENFSLAMIDNANEQETAAGLRRSMLFFSFSSREGFGLPPAEAMASGCLVVGYHGFGGREYFKPEFSYPVEEGDVLGFARAAEQAVAKCAENPEEAVKMGQQASEYILKEYSLELEELSVVAAWKKITGS